MSDSTVRTRMSWKILVFALGAALGASLWAALGGEGCTGCQAASSPFPRRELALAGSVGYAGLLGTALFGGPGPFLTAGILVAAGVHAGLLAALVQLRSFCPPCLVAAGAAALALGSLIACDRSAAFRASLVSPLVASLIQVWALGKGGMTSPAPETAALSGSVDRGGWESTPVVPGTVSLIAYTRPDCGYCIELERDVLPELLRDYGGRLRVDRRSAADLPGIPTPTLILTGARGRRVFPGLPQPADLRRAIDTVLGGPDGL